MKTQISRNSFDAQKRYSGIYQQMGRMLTDADWNEFSDLEKNRLSDAIIDIIGNGTPRQRGLVEIVKAMDGSKSYVLKWGYACVEGIIAQVRPDSNSILTDPTGSEFEYDHQRDFPQAPPLLGDYTFYLDVWDRTVLVLEDHELRDVGLQGADTCTRTQTMAQVKWCEQSIDPENSDQNPSIGNTLLSLIIRQGSTEPDPCDPCANEIALQDSVGNYLYRVEVHDVQYSNDGAPLRITLKWSSENGAEQYVIGDTPEGFESSNWAYEFYHGQAQSFASEKHLGKHLVSGFSPARGELTKDYPDLVPSGYELVRRWDGFCSIEKVGSDWLLVVGSGVDRGVDLSSESSSDAHGHVTEGSTIIINMDTVTATLEIADWQLLAGDFWQAQVRQAIHIAGSEILSSCRPEGITHHYMTLGNVSDGVFTAYDSPDCKRFEFPTLTDIRADDVCYDNEVCDMPNVNTVQDAIDHLCHGKDLHWHNKHLHGWGIVCGLIAECCPDHTNSGGSTNNIEFDHRRHVCVTPGYALTCEGHDIILNKQQAVDVIEQVVELEVSGQAVLNNGEGTVCLRIDIGDKEQAEISVEAYDPETQKQSMFDGTLLMDFYQNCMLDLVEALKGELSRLNPGEIEIIENGVTGLVSTQRRKFTSVLNLIIQIVNSENGSYVFLSHKEHLFLKDLYLHLRELLKSKTFCAMFDNGEFPDYPFTTSNMTTYFGKNYHTKIIQHPNRKTFYTYGGTDNTINVYSIGSGELTAVLEMPSAEGAEITALTFSPDGNLLYAAASVRQTDTVFGRALINSDHAWEKMSILCDITISVMQILDRDAGLIYAVGVGKGLYQLRPDVIFEDTKPQLVPTYQFNAIGHIEIDSDELRAYCTSSSSNDLITKYNQIVVCDLKNRDEALKPNLTIGLVDASGRLLSGTDGLALRRNNSPRERRLYIIVDESDRSKQLLTYQRPLTPNSVIATSQRVEHTKISLAYHHPEDRLILSMEDGYRLQLIEPTGEKTTSFRVPVQIQPIDLFVDQINGQVYTLNFISNTISVIPAAELHVSNTFLQTLVDYRTKILLAYYSLFGNVLQYLKDCFCHHLLVKCPSCNDNNVLYLACVEIRNNEVYKICNFDKRKYVKSFPTMDYWLSLVPIESIIKSAINQLCCSVLPSIFSQYTDNVIRTPSTSSAEQQIENNVIKAMLARGTLQTVQRTDVSSLIRNQSKSVNTVAKMAGDSVANFALSNQTNQPGIKKQALIQAQSTDAVAELERNNIQVTQIEEYDSGEVSRYIADYTQTPQNIVQGSEVTLVQKNGRVMFYFVKEAKQTAAVSEVSSKTKAEIQDLENRKAVLEDLDSVKAQLAQEEENIAQIKLKRETLTAEISTLNESLAAMDFLRREIANEVNKGRPVKDIAGIDETIDSELKKVGIRTVEELASADKQGLSTNTKLNEATIDLIVENARIKLELLP